MKLHFNTDIQGLRKRKVVWGKNVANRRLWDPFSGVFRNGILNIGLSRNYVRLMYPMVPMFLMIYLMQPVIYGVIDLKYKNNYQWEGIYHKFGSTKLPYCD